MSAPLSQRTLDVQLGIDFGTTNSAVAVRRGSSADIVPLAPGELTQRTVIHCPSEGGLRFGNDAFRSYVQADLSGRFLRSIKSFLAQDVPLTHIGGKRYEFVDLIAHYLSFLIERTVAVTGQAVSEVVVGRPVTFTEQASDSERAEATLADALKRAGIDNFRFQLEPVAAAHKYEASAREDHLVLVGDFGGGTSDFAILRVGPQRRHHSDRSSDILAVDGVARAGDYLDGQFMECFILDELGKDQLYRERYTEALTPWTSTIFRQSKRLFDLHHLRDDRLDRALKFMQTRLVQPECAQRLRRLIFDDLGYPMAWAIEASKRALSTHDEADFVFDEFYSDRLDIHKRVQGDVFAAGCDETLRQYGDAITRTLTTAGVVSDQIDSVFLTGGTSQLPFIRSHFSERFGADKLHSSDALTSVCVGLALS